jgi:hypothetical protein
VESALRNVYERPTFVFDNKSEFELVVSNENQQSALFEHERAITDDCEDASGERTNGASVPETPPEVTAVTGEAPIDTLLALTVT